MTTPPSAIARNTPATGLDKDVSGAAARGPPLTDRDGTGGYQIATGLPGEPVPPTILSGDQTSRNS